MNILIRADAGGNIGTGHVMRMLALAQACMRRGLHVTLASVDCPAVLARRVASLGIDIQQIHAEKIGSHEDAKSTLAAAKELNCQWIITDGYHFDYEYQVRIKQSGRSLLCLDDYKYTERWHCDALLNQNLDAEKTQSYSSEAHHAQLLLGAHYCLLREEFLKHTNTRKEWKKIERLLITLGGSDPENATEATLQLVDSIPLGRQLHIRVIAGADNPHLNRLRAFSGRHHIETLTNVLNMPEQYDWADAIISAGGSTCWEWLHRGLPGAIVTIADNQLPIVKALTKERKAALPLGWFQQFDFKKHGSHLATWLENPNNLINQAEVRSIIDGNGADRIAGFLSGLPFMLRTAQAHDCGQYLQWANDAMVRANSFSSKIIDPATHRQWFQRRIESPNACLLVACSFENDPIGQVRFEFDSDTNCWTIGVSIDAHYRSKGLGRTLMLEALRWMRLHHGDDLTIRAEVINTNTASVRLFEASGFTTASTGKEYTTYSINP
ncbi:MULTISPECIES: UDP-2,4-diacetamido-2,4,6-trideoxy-beta-L-altropyranose hydrolase [unclassified Lentimonas]|uniref:UDP-2,4-diacetamido-2,4, 6-trideoxy-beta-L-altropyranose hydrolase n=1 Tax=unclassified Lentimonas TaxID=2630993 RepID=UPI00132B94D7|nr:MULTISPECIES: UDP-2,4-diacetamido-2,4,6-trideoxy-beta-L-altropyranose hydrolase [unclassified Lentimonas]CAA6676533.1 Unannotated [Lentimonas sp. CC4]CAA6685373.1 Unannotated [Lentimonas sp. CC6]CAA7074903.1 Unannotated [Lentimonas sp. CC4]CAA7169528.1 Unannotated [Lentimonas sp. CC21]CAA7182710.1 Unannotated [Lentimonas sp. CC8]